MLIQFLQYFSSDYPMNCQIKLSVQHISNLTNLLVLVRFINRIILAHRNKKTLGGASGEGLASGGFHVWRATLRSDAFHRASHSTHHQSDYHLWLNSSNTSHVRVITKFIAIVLKYVSEEIRQGLVY